MPVNRAAIKSELVPGLAAIWGHLESYAPEWKHVYKPYRSDKAQEIEQEVRFTGPADSNTREGEPIPLDNALGDRYTTTYVMQRIVLGFSITREAIDDNLYKSSFPMYGTALKTSFDQTQEILAAAPFNSAFDTNSPIADGQPMCSTTHPIDVGFVANRPSVDLDLNEASAEALLNLIGVFRDNAGNISKVLPETLYVNIQNQWVANRLDLSTFRTGTNINDISVINHDRVFKKGVLVSHFLNQNNWWFILNSAADGLKFYLRNPLELDVYPDPITYNVTISGYTRYAYGITNFRAVAGSMGP